MPPASTTHLASLPLRVALVALLSLTIACHHVGAHRGARLRETLLSTRLHDALATSRIERMAASPVSFYRASLALFRRDWIDDAEGLSRSRFTLDQPRPFGVGDAHVENFGTLLGRDGRVTFEPDDLDAATRVPYLWDLRRLTIGLCVAARTSNRDDADARHTAAHAAHDVAFAAARAYADALVADTTEAPTADGALVEDLLRRATADANRRDELRTLTVLDGAQRRLRRGSLDREDPTRQLLDASPATRDALGELFERYRATLTAPPDATAFTPLDVARALGRGVASASTARLLVLLRGPTDAPDDDLLVEVKELPDAITPEDASDADPVERVLSARALLWSRPDADPYWGAITWRGCPVQIRAETDASKGLRVARMRGPLGTPAALVDLARTLGARLAWMHRRSLPSPAPHAALIARDLDGFAEEQAERSTHYADLVFADWRRLRRLARDGARLRAREAAPTQRPPCALFDAP